MHRGGWRLAGRPSFPAMPRLKVTTFTVRASQEQAHRWARVARYLGCRSVSDWLEEMAEEQAQRIAKLLPPP